jgi:hypothetical protein
MAKTPKKPEVTPAAHGGNRPGSGRKPQVDQDRIRNASTMVRSSEAWKLAIQEFAEWDRAPSVSDLVDRAILDYARSRKYDKPIPRR